MKERALMNKWFKRADGVTLSIMRRGGQAGNRLFAMYDAA